MSWLVEQRDGKNHVLGLLAFGDRIKQGSREAVARLRQMGIDTVMLTGDNRGAAQAVARQLGIGHVHAEVLPADKAAVVTALRGQGRRVAMVGDGINDAPALACSDVGLAMATGTDVAMHSAGITLMRGEPELVVDALLVARRSYRKIRQNLGWAFIYNVIGLPLAAFGLLNPVLAGAAMAASSVSVVGNALLLRRWPAKATAGEPNTPATGELEMKELNVEGMSCNHCAGRVTQAVQSVDPDARVDIDLASATVRVESAAALEAVVAAITAAGYPATVRAPA